MKKQKILINFFFLFKEKNAKSLQWKIWKKKQLLKLKKN